LPQTRTLAWRLLLPAFFSSPLAAFFPRITRIAAWKQTLCIFAAQRGLGHYLRTHYADRTFEHLYRWNLFDFALLAPYFLVMVVLSFYGIHRYQLVYRFYKFRKNATREPAARFTDLPTVTVQLPVFNERFVIERLIQACCSLDYPREKLEIQVLDDSTDETSRVAREAVERYRAMGRQIEYVHRSHRTGFKAGALQAGMARSRGEFIAIFDADFVPSPDWLMRVVHHFSDPGVGMVQTRWTHLNRDYSFLTQVEAILLDGHFILEHGARSRMGAYFNFNGTAGMWRRTAIETSGGWQHDTLTEDTDLSYRAQLQGWRFLYLLDVECPAELPVEMTAFKTQQARWAKGLIQTSKKILPLVLRSDAPFKVKLEAVYHLTANISYPLMIVLSTLLMPAMIIRFYQGWFQMLLIDMPLFLASTFSISSFYLVSQKVLFPKTWRRKLVYLPFLMSFGIGLTVTNSCAVMEALLGIQTAFKRTPKYRIEARGQKLKSAGRYRKRLGVTPWIELLIGCYFALTIWYAIVNDNFFTVPFLLLFVVGYWVTGLLSLLQGRFERFRLKGPADDSPAKPFPVGV
jgi:cellulose synthase/poly-beta-1,6-N-acetylglucosamine synthase-like glycosyltransferase